MALTENKKRAIKRCTEERLELCANLYDEDIPDLVEILQSNTTIKYLDLSCNLIGEKGAIKLAELKHLIHLNLSNNDITNKAVQTLLLNKKLISLHCSGNPSLDDTLAKLILKNPTHHTSLKFNKTKMSEEILYSIQDMCEGNRKLHNPFLQNQHEEQKETSQDSTESVSANTDSSNLPVIISTEFDAQRHQQREQPAEENNPSASRGFFTFFKCLPFFSTNKPQADAKHTSTPSRR